MSKHVLRVIDEKVVAALKVKGHVNTAKFIEKVLTWWKLVNVKIKGETKRFNDPARSVKEQESTSLQPYIEHF